MKFRITLMISILFVSVSVTAFAQNFNYSQFAGHSHAVNSVAFSPNGRMLASGSADDTIRLWNSHTGAHLNELIHGGDVHSVAFSPDGSMLASGGSRNTSIYLWDTNTGENIKVLRGHLHAVYSVAFSPSGDILASGSRDGTIRLWDVNTGETLKTLTAQNNAVNSVAFSPDGKTIASGGNDGTVRIWNTNTGANLKILRGHASIVNSVVFSPDGKTIASGSYEPGKGSNGSVRLWDVNTGETLKILTGHSKPVSSVVFSPDGKTIASGSSDNTIRLWDVNTGENLKTLTAGHSARVNSVAFSPDGKTIASGSHDRTIRLWDTVEGNTDKLLAAHQNDIHKVMFNPSGDILASIGSGTTLRLWNANTGGFLAEIGSVYGDAAISPDGKTLASRGRNSTQIALWSLNTMELLQVFTGRHTDVVLSIAFNPNGKTIASGSQDYTIRLWDANTGAHLNTLIGQSGWINSVAFSPDGSMLASGSQDGTIRLWDTNTGENLKTLTGRNPINSVAFSPYGKTIASGSSDSTIRLWDTNTGENLKTLTGHDNSVSSVAFSPDGSMLASGSWDYTIRIWRVKTGSVMKILTGSGTVYSVAFNPDGQTLASGDSVSIKLWDLPPTHVTLTPNPIVPPAAGEQFTVNIGIVAADNIFGYEFSLGFDPAVLRYVESANGDYLPGAFLEQPVVTDSTITVEAIALAALGKGDGTLATVTFEVVNVTESSINLFDVKLIDSGENTVPSFIDSAWIEPALMPSSAVVSLTPASAPSPEIGEQLTFNVDIAGGQDVVDYQLYFHQDTSALKYIDYSTSEYISEGGSGDGSLGTVTFEVVNVQKSTIDVSGYLVALNGLRYLPTFTSAKVIVPLVGDVNGDGVVNILDLVVVAANFGEPVSEEGNPADVNGDGRINIIDLVKVAGAFGTKASAPFALNGNLKGLPTRAELQQWLTQAQASNLTDPLSKRGILLLEQLLAALTPKETALLANYPNPFNPETWIPYQLAAPADVTLTIYALDGKIVRRLTLGYKPVGIYQNKSRAAFWDGRNAQGEPVASGMYFYTLKAGDFTATRKMLIRK